ncbi:DMT family transporter [Roseobacteraceae bacterium S113]
MALILDIETSRRANLIGAGWMIAAMALFAIEDALLKAAAGALPFAQVMVLFGIGGALLFAALARVRGERILVTQARAPAMWIRAVFETMGRLFYVLAVVMTPLSEATVILQATPLVVVAGAALLFGERVGWRRWAAIFVGLAGVLLIIQPGTTGFSALSLLAVVGMIGLAGRDLASRAAPKGLSTNVLGFYGFLCVILAGGLFSFWEGRAFVWPSSFASGVMMAAVVTGIAAYSSLMKAMRTGEVGAVTPFRYTRLIFGVALGVLIFGERLDGVMLAGAALIVLSGLFILGRARG